MRPGLHSVVAAAGVTVMALLTPAPSAVAAPPDLVTTVTEHLLTMEVSGAPAATGRHPVVRINRQAAGWAFGTAVLAGKPGTETHPHGWLFLARLSGAGWQIGFEGQPAFAQLSAAAAPVTSPTERELFASLGAGPSVQQANGDYRTGMRLPFATLVSWIMTGGPHGWTGSDTPFSSLDLAGGDQVVRAARGGTAYTLCPGWIRVVHDRGYETDYYHLWNNINVSGAPVNAGARLGDTGTDVTCGGTASGRHVHFALRQNGAYVGIGGHNVGKWVPIAGAAQYGGYALHGSTTVYPGGALHNYGALGLTQGIIDANGGGYVNKRSGPGTGFSIVGTVNDGVTVSVSCSSNGTTHTGRWGTTSLWNRLTDGTWVSDAFMWTGLDTPVNGYC